MSFEVTLGGAWRSDGNARMSLEELRGGWRSHGNTPIITQIHIQIHIHISWFDVTTLKVMFSART